MIIQNGNTNIDGTHLQGYIECSYDDLVNTFGTPTIEGGMETKIEVEWELTFIESTRTDDNHEVVTIYNWKNGKRYCGEEEGLEVQDIKQWHIGGHRRYAVDLVHDAIKNYKDKKVD
jgi:hypothetical protein